MDPDRAPFDIKTTPAFAGFEWMIAFRYLRARRREGYISVIAGFSFLGIMSVSYTHLTLPTKA